MYISSNICTCLQYLELTWVIGIAGNENLTLLALAKLETPRFNRKLHFKADCFDSLAVRKEQCWTLGPGRIISVVVSFYTGNESVSASKSRIFCFTLKQTNVLSTGPMVESLSCTPKLYKIHFNLVFLSILTLCLELCTYWRSIASKV